MTTATQTLNASPSKKTPSSLKKVIACCMIGNGLEWYDYALYAQMSFIISELFFPGTDESAKLIATFGVFAVGFVFRPLGAILFGYIGDRYGRRLSLVIAILMMAIPTGCIGLLPTYSQIGMAAPILLTIIRIFQGLSLGGEFSGSITYMVEHSPQEHRGLTGSACVVSLIIGFLMGSFVALLFVNSLSPEDFRTWGWRVPFILGIVIGFVGLYIRRQCDESPAYEEAKQAGHISDKPVRTAIMQHPRKMLIAFALYISVTMPFYLVSVYLLSFSKTKLGLAVGDALFINTATMLTMLVAVIIAAYASDRIGRKPVLLLSVLVMMVAVIPLFMWMASAIYLNVLLAQMLLGLIVGCYVSCMPTVLVEIFPTSIRYTGMAMAYNFAAAAFGGTAPMVCEWLIGTTGSNYSIAYYVIACNLASLAALYFYKDRYKEPLLG